MDVRDRARERSLTGEESQFEQEIEEAAGPSHRSLGTLAADKLEHLLEVWDVHPLTLYDFFLQKFGGSRLFEDPDFPADARALFYSERSEEELASFSWARPHQLVDQPSIFVDGTSRRDVIQVLTRVLMISSDH